MYSFSLDWLPLGDASIEAPLHIYPNSFQCMLHLFPNMSLTPMRGAGFQYSRCEMLLAFLPIIDFYSQSSYKDGPFLSTFLSLLLEPASLMFLRKSLRTFIGNRNSSIFFLGLVGSSWWQMLSKWKRWQRSMVAPFETQGIVMGFSTQIDGSFSSYINKR